MDNYIRSGDLAIFNQPFGNAIVTVPPGVMSGSASKSFAAGPPICLEGDEKKITVGGIYMTPSFPVPGACTVQIQQLGGDQTSKKTTVEGKPPILKGSTFQAKMTVTTPASLVTPGGKQDDPVPNYMGNGTFNTSNTSVMDGG